MNLRDPMLVILNTASTLKHDYNITKHYMWARNDPPSIIITVPYLYSEVEHQAVGVSLRQLIEKISPRGVRYHLLEPSRRLKSQETGLVWFIWFILFFKYAT